MKAQITCALALFLAGNVRVVAAQEPAFRQIRGNVMDSLGYPVGYALIEQSVSSRTVSDDSGHFELRALRSARVRLLVRRIGFQPASVEIEAGGDTTMTVVLSQLAHALSPVAVEASSGTQRLRASGFYDRLLDRQKGLGSGTFITAEDIERRNPLRISQMLEALPGVRVQKFGDGYTQYEILGPARCRYTVYLNGARIGPKEFGNVIHRAWIDEYLEPSATAGIEVYTRATSAPPHLQMLSGGCGVVAFWTK